MFICMCNLCFLLTSFQSHCLFQLGNISNIFLISKNYMLMYVRTPSCQTEEDVKGSTMCL